MSRGRKATNNFTMGSNQIWLMGEYIQLSKEDGNNVSYSVENQKRILDRHRNTNEENFVLVDTYIDDGETGTDSDRDGFQRLLKDIYAKRINCVIVKDLSRLSRNDYECGQYLEFLFVKLNIRFISLELPVLDSYLRPQEISSIATKMQSCINDQHAFQTSIKVRSVQDMKRSDGDYIGAFAPY